MTTPSRRASQKGRPGARSRRLPPPPQSFIDRNRSRLLWGAAAVIVVVIGAFAFIGPSVTPAYSCSIEWTPPASSPGAAPGATLDPSARLGFIQDDMGRGHLDNGTRVTYIFCPPASGKHYNEEGVTGPIPPKFYDQNAKLVPQNWIHNLEHGALVLLYKCPSDACTDAGQQALRGLYTSMPNSPICNLPPGANGVGPVFARFDNMAPGFTYFALVWDEVLPLTSLDGDQIKAFWLQQGERTNPEKICSGPSPGPSDSTAPTGSAAPAATPAPTDTPTPSQPSSSSSATTPAPS